MVLFKKRIKVFCIGQNKTGTTSLTSVLQNLGYRIGNQVKAEMLADDWSKRDFRNIVKLCKTADAFQDVPFSNDFTYGVLDYAFPGSKFILTVRKDKDEWYDSLIRFHTKIIGKGRVPTADDLKEFNYRNRFKGFLWESMRTKYGVDESSLYDYKVYTDQYELYNARVEEYFKYRPNDLLVLNLAETNAMEEIYRFLGFKYNGEQMPHVNKSSDKKTES